MGQKSAVLPDLIMAVNSAWTVLDDDFLRTILEPGSPRKMIKDLNLFLNNLEEEDILPGARKICLQID